MTQKEWNDSYGWVRRVAGNETNFQKLSELSPDQRQQISDSAVVGFLDLFKEVCFILFV